jgi:L-ascorbate metabolism protein UlaG (beta-lactamase superfamily)
MRRITWFGHATVLIETTDGTRLLTDPVLRSRVAHLRRRVPAPRAGELDELDGILISHVHQDHLDRPTLRGLARNGTTVVVPPGAGRLLRGMRFSTVQELSAGDRAAVGDSEVRAVPAWHSARRLPVTRELEALGYVVDRVWFAGDTDIDERMERLRGSVDVALMPIWGWGPSLGPGHVDPESAARAMALVQPKVAIPIHWGTYLPYGLMRRHGNVLSDPGPAFAEHVARLAPDVRVATLAVGESVEV